LWPAVSPGIGRQRAARHLAERRGALNIVFAIVIIAVVLYMLARNITVSSPVDRMNGAEGPRMTKPNSLARPGRTRRQALGLFGLGAVMLGTGSGPARAEDTEEKVLTEAMVLRDPDIPVAGNPNGDITIVEWFDYNCPYCRKLEPELRQVVQDDGKVRLVLKDWPILSPVSKVAARMALAARYQDKFVQAHDAMIGVSSKLTEPRIRELLAGAGLDVDRLERDLSANAGAIDAVLARNNDQAEAFGFRGTPSFIVGKFRVPGVLTMAQFEQVIADARKAKMN
jgi:protein-disulfide isomerase